MNITWMGGVGCCSHGVWFKEDGQLLPRCCYCEKEEREHPHLKELREIKELLRRKQCPT